MESVVYGRNSSFCAEKKRPASFSLINLSKLDELFIIFALRHERHRLVFKSTRLFFPDNNFRIVRNLIQFVILFGRVVSL